MTKGFFDALLLPFRAVVGYFRKVSGAQRDAKASTNCYMCHGPKPVGDLLCIDCQIEDMTRP